VTERWSLPCGCGYVKAGGKWYQVVACPEHVMDMRPRDDVPVPAEEDE